MTQEEKREILKAIDDADNLIDEVGYNWRHWVRQSLKKARLLVEKEAVT